MHYIHYHGRISPQGVRNLETLILAAQNAGHPEVTICICSEGGDVNSGIGLYNYIKMLPIKVHTHCTGLCDSIAATIFLAGKKRSSVPLASFTTHAATYSEGPDKGEIAPNTHLISQPFKDKLDWSSQEILERFGVSNFRMDPAYAKELGVIDKIEIIELKAVDTIVNVNLPS